MSKLELKTPRLLWMHDGQLQFEDYRSAEEVIEQWKKKHTTNQSAKD